MDKTAQIFNIVREQALALIGDGGAKTRAPLPLTSFIGEQPLA